MSTYLYYLLEDAEESIAHENIELNEHRTINDSSGNNNHVSGHHNLLQEIIAEFDLIRDYEPRTTSSNWRDH